MLRFAATVLALLAVASVSLGAPLCCVTGADCCATPNPTAEKPCCPNCKSDHPPTRPAVPAKCHCGEKTPTTVVDHTPAFVPAIIEPLFDLVPGNADRAFDADVGEVRRGAPPGCGTILLPLLL